MPIPTVAVIEGVALGGGAELSLACDLRVVGPDAVFAFPEAQLGIIPGAGGTQRLPRAVGVARAKELIFTGRRVGASEALVMGLAEHGVQTGSPMEKALELAQAVARSAPLSLRMAKEAISQVGGAVGGRRRAFCACAHACVCACVRDVLCVRLLTTTPHLYPPSACVTACGAPPY
jgi:enoyl-CoA hydratase/carnithine racemase